MNAQFPRQSISLPAALATFLAVACFAGCGQSASNDAAKDNKDKAASHDHDHEHGDDEQEGAGDVAHEGHVHGEWWCDEHGVPEEICGLCNSKLAAEFQKKGDWCKEHDRPDSQCFVCHPELEARFAAQYEAKYGKQPPKPQ